MECQDILDGVSTRMHDKLCKYNFCQYKLFKRIEAMSTDDLEILSCKFGVTYERSCPRILKLCVPVHLPDINYSLNEGTGKTYAEMFSFYWTVWNSVFTKTFFHGWSSGALADFISFSDPFVAIKHCSPGIYLGNQHTKLLFMALIANKIIRRSDSYIYAVEQEQTEKEIGYTVIEVHEEKPALVTDMSVITLGEVDFAFNGM